MPLRRVLAILALMKSLEAVTHADSWLNTTEFQDERVKREVETGSLPNGDFVGFWGDEGLFSASDEPLKNTSATPMKITDSKLLHEETRRCNMYGRKKRCHYKLTDELNKKEPERDILAQLDYDIEEQEMDKRSRIELLSYLDAAVKNKKIELDLELRRLAKEEQNLQDKQQVEVVNSNAAVLTANIEQLNKRIKDLEERTQRMKKMKERKLLEKMPEVKETLSLLGQQDNTNPLHHISYLQKNLLEKQPEVKEALNLLDQQSYINAIHQLSSKEPSQPLTIAPVHHFTKSAEIGKSELLVKDTGNRAVSKSRMNFGYVPYQYPMPYSDPLQILRLTNPDFAALAQPAPWLSSGWAPTLYQYPVDRPYPLYAALARHQALPVPLRKG